MKSSVVALCLIFSIKNLFAFDVPELIKENKYKIDRTCTIGSFDFANYYDNLFKSLPGYIGRVATVLKEVQGEKRIVVVGELNNPIWKSDKMDLSNGIVVNKADFSIWKSSSIAGSLNRVLFFDHKTQRGYFYSHHINALRWLGEGESRSFKIEFSNCQIK